MITLITNPTMSNFGQALLILMQGMTGIFFFMALFYLLILGLEKLFKPRTSQ